MTRSRLRAVLAFFVAVTLVTTALPPGVLGDHGDSVDWPDGPTRAFYADDPDGGNVTDAAADGNTSLANVTDFYYRSTTPTFTANGTTLAEYRRQQLLSVERSREDSKYLPSSEPTDGSAGYIEDAHVTFLGVVGGGRPVVTGDDDPAPLYVPSDGEALNFLDYRIDESALPEPRSEEITPNITEVYTNYEIDWSETGVDEREVLVNGEVVGQASERPDARVVDYEGADGDGTVSLTVRATVTVRMTYDVVTYYKGEETDRTEHTEQVGRLTVTDSRGRNDLCPSL